MNNGTSESAPPTALDAAREYLRRGWYSIDLKPRSKVPIPEAWPDKRYTELELPNVFVGRRNIGFILGEPSKVADADLDCAEANELADLFLPSTDAVFGRLSTPRAHRLYTVDGSFGTIQFEDPTMSGKDAMLIELRGTGGQTMAPPSIHPEGESVAWDRPFEQVVPAMVAYPDLLFAVQELAAAALLRRHQSGSRHDSALQLAGVFVRSGWDFERATRMVLAVVGEDERADRERAVSDTFERYRNGEPISCECAERFGEKVWRAVSTWLGLKFGGGNGADHHADAIEEPRPLTRPLTPASAFPIWVLSEVPAAMVRAIHQKTRAPESICGTSTLAAINWVVQAHADIELPTGDVRPISDYFVTIAETGERKTAADDSAIAAIREHERELETQYRRAYDDYKLRSLAWAKLRDQVNADKHLSTVEAKMCAIAALGEEPQPPRLPIHTTTDPTVEGLIRLRKEGLPRLGVFSDEGGQLMGGYAMQDDNRLKTGGAFSALWDGKETKRSRGGDGNYAVRGQRVNMHILLQPLAADRLFGDPVLNDQGMISRVLPNRPEPAAGTRAWAELSESDVSAMRAFTARMDEIIRVPLSLAQDDKGRPVPNQLALRVLRFSNEARALWIAFVNDTERRMAPGGEYESIKGLANKLGEHAARLAGTLALFDDLNVAEISGEYLARGIELSQFYADEAVRVREMSQVDAGLVLGQKLLEWLQTSGKTIVSLREVYQLGPRPIRDRDTALKAMGVLEAHGWVTKTGPIVIDGKHRRDAWRIVSPPDEV